MTIAVERGVNLFCCVNKAVDRDSDELSHVSRRLWAEADRYVDVGSAQSAHVLTSLRIPRLLTLLKNIREGGKKRKGTRYSFL